MERAELKATIHDLNLDHISEAAEEHVADTFGPEFLDEPPSDERCKAKDYVEGRGVQGRLKQLTDRTMGLVAGLIFPLPIRAIASGIEGIKEVKGHPGIYNLQTAFMDGRTFTHPKLRTMIPDVHRNLPTWQHISFCAFRKDRSDVLLPYWWTRALRMTGFDETPQLSLIGKEMTIAGVRAMSTLEIEGTKTLVKVCTDPFFEISDKARAIIQEHADIFNQVKPRMAFVGAHSALDQPLTTHLVRMLVTNQYLKHASQAIDWKIVRDGVLKRAKKAVSREKQIEMREN